MPQELAYFVCVFVPVGWQEAEAEGGEHGFEAFHVGCVAREVARTPVAAMHS